MDFSVDRRQVLKAGAGLAAGVALAGAVGEHAADAAVKKPMGSIAIERLWGSRKVKRVKVLNTKGLYDGTDKKTLNLGGACHWIGTAQPLGLGNCVLFAHRTAAGGPLRKIQTMKVGDAIVVKVGAVTKTYLVVQSATPASPKVPYEIIGSRDFAKAINWGDKSQANLTLVACTKPNGLPTSTGFRLLIRATAI